MKSVSTPRISSRSTLQALSTSAADGLSSIASSRCSTVMNSCCFCRASTKAMWRETSSSCAIIWIASFGRIRLAAGCGEDGHRSSLLHRALQRVLVLSREIDHLVDLCRGDLAHVCTAHLHPLAMHLQHHLRGLFPAHGENSLQHDNDKVHGCVIV